MIEAFWITFGIVAAICIARLSWKLHRFYEHGEPFIPEERF